MDDDDHKGSERTLALNSIKDSPSIGPTTSHVGWTFLLSPSSACPSNLPA